MMQAGLDGAIAGRWLGAVALSGVLLAGGLAGPAAGQQFGPQSVADLAEALQDMVVNISTSQTLRSPRGGVPLPNMPQGSPFEELFEDFFNRQQEGGGPARRASSLGSGFVVDPSGLIVTNNHVIDGADEIMVNFNDGTKLVAAEVVGRDQKTDLALLRVEPRRPLKAAQFGDSTAMRVGDWVMAIGNPFGLGGSVSLGIISAVKRDINTGLYDEFLQTDAAINRGNSGGPLFDMHGKVIGVNTAIISPTGGSIGIGFAIPSSTAMHVIEQLRAFGQTRRGWLGVRIQTVSEEIAESLGMTEPTGALVSGVTPDGPAAQAGIEAGDVVLEFAGEQVSNMRVLPRIVARAPIGEAAEVKVLRKGDVKTYTVMIGRLPEEEAEQVTEDRIVPDEAPRMENFMLGLSMSALTDELRARFGIAGDVKGVVVTEVDPASMAAQQGLKPGDIIMEVTQEEVHSPADVTKRVEAAKNSGRSLVLLLIADGKGESRYVALPIDG